jgi:hypothetical protein
MKHILVIIDKGDVWEITGTTIQTDDYVVDPELAREIPIDAEGHEMFNYIKSRLPVASLQYSKDVSGNLIKEDLIEVEYNPLELKRANTLHKARTYVSTRLNIVSVFDIFDFMMASNTMASEGHFISSSNRREKYLEIIDTGKIELIDALETYLNSIDKLTVLQGWYRQYREFEKNIYNANTAEDINELYRVFVQIFD